MKINEASTKQAFFQLITDSHEHHVVCPAWISDESALTHVAESLLNFPKNSYIPQVSGLHGRAYGVHPNPWHRLWRLCDEVKDGFETGTLLPQHKVTLLPAWTVTYGFKRDKARESIQNVFNAHGRFLSSEVPLRVFISWGRGLESELKEWLETEFDSMGGIVEIVYPPRGHDCHWSAA